MSEADELMALARDAFCEGFGGVLRIEPDMGAAFVVDGRGDECVVADKIDDKTDDGADAVWRAGAQTLTQIFARRRALQNAYLAGRIQIAGDMSVMARLHLEAAS
ncbi:MAG: hypothetical protein ACFB00_12010 [Parvularculaceae bacterium]